MSTFGCEKNEATNARSSMLYFDEYYENRLFSYAAIKIYRVISFNI